MRAILLSIFSLVSFLAFAQNGKKIELKHANSLEGSGTGKNGFQRLLGNVEFEHEGAIMTCDSAHLFISTNTLLAYGHVHISQGDSINCWGDNLKYNGNSREADLNGNVMMTDRDMTLTTQSIHYDMKGKVASYASGGTIVSQSNTLTSQIGAYSTEGKVLTFKKNVVLNNPEYIMKCDTLRYLPVSKVSYFTGPTTIVSTNHTNTIYCENGFYDTNADICQFQKNAKIVTKDQTLTGDSIWYNRKIGLGKAMKNIQIVDTSQDLVIRGELAVHNELTNESMITGRALYIQIFDEDSLFLHADTLKSIDLQKKNFDPEKDSTGSDSGKVVIAFHHVRFFKPDLQGKCDSLYWSSADSTMHLFGDPVMWSEGDQITSDSISILTSKGHIQRMNMNANAFIVSQEDSAHYNQIKGKKMTGYFVDNKLERIFVDGNGQTLYYAKDSADLIGVNRADCAKLLIELKDQKVKGIHFYVKPDAVLYPPADMNPKEALLKGFNWRETEKPESVEDLFSE